MNLSHERFIGLLIEPYAGNLPLWLAPDQVRVITLNDDEALINYAKPIVAELRANMVRVDADYSATPFKAKISNAEQLRVHTMLVIGGRDMEAGAVRVNGRGQRYFAMIGFKAATACLGQCLRSVMMAFFSAEWQGQSGAAGI